MHTKLTKYQNSVTKWVQVGHVKGILYELPLSLYVREMWSTNFERWSSSVNAGKCESSSADTVHLNELVRVPKRERTIVHKTRWRSICNSSFPGIVHLNWFVGERHPWMLFFTLPLLQFSSTTNVNFPQSWLWYLSISSLSTHPHFVSWHGFISINFTL